MKYSFAKKGLKFLSDNREGFVRVLLKRPSCGNMIHAKKVELLRWPSCTLRVHVWQRSRGRYGVGSLDFLVTAFISC